ncbi:MAG: hypothetical protein Q8R82_03370 [Hyphomonadaceae bacterium]|nr:hypothetical protein [Hyphomonadaceae bacterium]
MRAILASVALFGVAGCDGLASGSSAIPADTLLAVGEGQDTAAYGQVVSGSVALNAASPPVAFETLAAGPTCNKPKARPGAKAAYVYTYGGGVHVPLQHVSFRDTPEQAEQRRAAVRNLKGLTQQNAMTKEFSAFQAGNAVEWSSRIDVLVTETQAPVFLYLSSYDPILWNIQLAPGASLDGVVVNSYDASSVANGTDAARTALVSFDNSPSSKCYVEPPIRAIPVADRIAAARKMNPDFNPGPYRQQWEQDYRKGQMFNAETRRLIGKLPDWIVTRSADGNGINAILIGPPPAAPFAPQPITRLQIPSHITTFWGSRRDAFKAFGLEEAI